jgi:hypothetical protein
MKGLAVLWFKKEKSANWGKLQSFQDLSFFAA